MHDELLENYFSSRIDAETLEASNSHNAPRHYFRRSLWPVGNVLLLPSVASPSYRCSLADSASPLSSISNLIPVETTSWCSRIHSTSDLSP